jgi:hypothetical protein
MNKLNKRQFFTVNMLLFANLFCIFYESSHSLFNYIYFYFFFYIIVVKLMRGDKSDYHILFHVNSFFCILFFLLQKYNFPVSYGFTDPNISSGTDDSFFYTLIADVLPNYFPTRQGYEEQSSTFTSLIKIITPTKIEHPYDIIFFQSGTMALLCVSSTFYANVFVPGSNVTKRVYWLLAFCPFLMMNGGAVFVRDVLVASLLMLSIFLITKKELIFSAAIFVLNFIIRPGTTLLVLPVIAILEIKSFIKIFMAHKSILLYTIIFLFLVVLFTFNEDQIYHLFNGTGEGGQVSILGRELIAGMDNNNSENALFLTIKRLPFIFNFLLSGLYVFFYPFINMKQIFETNLFDTRALVLSFFCPIYFTFMNTFFFSALFVDSCKLINKRILIFAYMILLCLIGVYSLQGRHKVISMPFYYIIVSIGMIYSNYKQKLYSFLLSLSLFVAQIFVHFLK